MYELIIIFSLLLILVILKTYLAIKETYGIDWDAEYLKHKGRCFDCEKQMINMYGKDAAWMGQQAKSFDSERDAVLQANSNGFLAKTIRYY